VFVFYEVIIFFRKIYSVANFWFLISIIDWSIAYRPESKTLMDLDTALNFFFSGQGRDQAQDRQHGQVTGGSLEQEIRRNDIGEQKKVTF